MTAADKLGSEVKPMTQHMIRRLSRPTEYTNGILDHIQGGRSSWRHTRGRMSFQPVSADNSASQRRTHNLSNVKLSTSKATYPGKQNPANCS